MKKVAPAELDVDDEQTAELLQSFPIDVRLFFIISTISVLVFYNSFYVCTMILDSEGY